MHLSVHFSSGSDEWATPQKTFDDLNREFGPFDLDVCATASNAKCSRFYDKAANGLEQDWAAKNWCNPPYSQLKRWVLKARREQLKGNLTVMLIPARTDTAVFHDSLYRKENVDIRFLRGRLHYSDGKGSSPFPSMVVIFRT
jgi:phage N-6-adenine-methyltransferase